MNSDGPHNPPTVGAGHQTPMSTDSAFLSGSSHFQQLGLSSDQKPLLGEYNEMEPAIPDFK